jgi:Rrf2 family protein
VKLGTRTKYTLRLMMGIGRLASDGRPVPLNRVSKVSGISRRYLDQLAIALKNAALIRSHSGRGGGYTLERPANQITVGEIVEAAIGRIDISECVHKPESCIHSDFCSCRLLYQMIHHRIVEVLQDVTLADLLDEDWAKAVRRELDGSEAEETRSAAARR